MKLWRQFIKNCERSGRFNPSEDVPGASTAFRATCIRLEMLDATLDVKAVFICTAPTSPPSSKDSQRRALKETGRRC